MSQRPSINEYSLEDFRGLGPPAIGECAGKRIDAYLAENFPFRSRNAWQKTLSAGQVLINGEKIARSSYKLRSGDRVTYYHPLEAEPEVIGRVIPVYEEDGVLAAFKPAGLPMHEGGVFRHQTFARWVKEAAGDQWAAIHRLDRETSGMVLCGATPDIRRVLTEDLFCHRIKKEYLAIVKGMPSEDRWFVDQPLGDLKASKIRIKRWVVEGGDPSKTIFEVLGRSSAGYALLRARPLTGRTNQIRIHSAYGGFPLLGDKLYQPEEEVFIDYQTNGLTEYVMQKIVHPRLCLHAAALSFFHPVTKRNVRVTCEVPKDFAELWRSLTKENPQEILI